MIRSGYRVHLAILPRRLSPRLPLSSSPCPTSKPWLCWIRMWPPFFPRGPRKRCSRPLPPVPMDGFSSSRNHPRGGDQLGPVSSQQVPERPSLPEGYSVGVCLLVGCLTSQQQVSVSQGRICSDNFMCCPTEIEVADQTLYLTQGPPVSSRPLAPSSVRLSHQPARTGSSLPGALTVSSPSPRTTCSSEYGQHDSGLPYNRQTGSGRARQS